MKNLTIINLIFGALLIFMSGYVYGLGQHIPVEIEVVDKYR